MCRYPTRRWLANSTVGVRSNVFLLRQRSPHPWNPRQQHDIQNRCGPSSVRNKFGTYLCVWHRCLVSVAVPEDVVYYMVRQRAPRSVVLGPFEIGSAVRLLTRMRLSKRIDATGAHSPCKHNQAMICSGCHFHPTISFTSDGGAPRAPWCVVPEN